MACECSTHFNIRVVRQLAAFLPPDVDWLAGDWLFRNREAPQRISGEADGQEQSKGLSERLIHPGASQFRLYANVMSLAEAGRLHSLNRGPTSPFR